MCDCLWYTQTSLNRHFTIKKSVLYRTKTNHYYNNINLKAQPYRISRRKKHDRTFGTFPCTGKQFSRFLPGTCVALLNRTWLKRAVRRITFCTTGLQSQQQIPGWAMIFTQHWQHWYDLYPYEQENKGGLHTVYMCERFVICTLVTCSHTLVKSNE